MIAALICCLWMLTGLGLITAGLLTHQPALIALGVAPLVAMASAWVAGVEAP